MGHHSCCNKQKVRRGLWSPEEDEKLVNCIATYGHGCWSSVPKLAGLERCGKSCRLRWINYLRPDLKRGNFSSLEESIIIELHNVLGNRWAQIAKHLPGRTDNEVKNFWNSSIKKKLAISNTIAEDGHKSDFPANNKPHNHINSSNLGPLFPVIDIETWPEEAIIMHLEPPEQVQIKQDVTNYIVDDWNLPLTSSGSKLSSDDDEKTNQSYQQGNYLVYGPLAGYPFESNMLAMDVMDSVDSFMANPSSSLGGHFGMTQNLPGHWNP